MPPTLPDHKIRTRKHAIAKDLFRQGFKIGPGPGSSGHIGGDDPANNPIPFPEFDRLASAQKGFETPRVPELPHINGRHTFNVTHCVSHVKQIAPSLATPPIVNTAPLPVVH
jgi:hypothetical protein